MTHRKTTDVVEPDWFADGDFSWLEAAQAEATSAETADAESQTEAGAATNAAEDISEPMADLAGEADLSEEEEPGDDRRCGRTRCEADEECGGENPRQARPAEPPRP